jgi:hypothetical protein
MALITISGRGNLLPLLHDFTTYKLGRPLLAIMRAKILRLLVFQTQWKSILAISSIPASLCLLSLPHLHTIPTGTTGPARSLRT